MRCDGGCRRKTSVGAMRRDASHCFTSRLTIIGLQTAGRGPNTTDTKHPQLICEVEELRHSTRLNAFYTSCVKWRSEQFFISSNVRNNSIEVTWRSARSLVFNCIFTNTDFEKKSHEIRMWRDVWSLQRTRRDGGGGEGGAIWRKCPRRSSIAKREALNLLTSCL